MVKKKKALIEWTLLAREDLKDVLEFYKNKDGERVCEINFGII